MNKIRSYGGDGQKAFFGECQKRGVDPQWALGQAKMLFNQIYPNHK